MRKYSLMAILAILLCAVSSSARQSSGGSSSAEFLRLSAGAHAPAIGGAMTASADGAMSNFYNPAGLGWGKREVSATYQSLAGEANYGDLAIAIPFGEHSGASLAVKYVDYGAIDRTTMTTAGGIVTGNRNGTFGANDFSASLGIGHRWTNLSLGLTGKLISSKLDNATAIAGAVDLGLQYKFEKLPLPDASVQFGASVQNLGSKLRFDFVNEDLPFLGRVGAMASFFKGRARLHGDIEFARNENVAFMGGGEIDVVSMLTLRAGL